MAEKDLLGHVPADQKILEIATAAKKAQQQADDLKQQASLSEDPAEREALLTESDKKEAEARKHSREARRLASGAWQGAANGVGIGAAIGAGLGTVVGTLVATIASIPTVGLGALIGIPVGLIHGPWVKVDGVGKPDREISEEEQHQAVIKAVEAAEEQQKAQDQGNGTAEDGDRH